MPTKGLPIRATKADRRRHEAEMRAYAARPPHVRYVQVLDGDWIEPSPQEGHRMRCCDCGLVHVIDFLVVEGRAQFRPIRDKRATAAARRRAAKVP